MRQELKTLYDQIDGLRQQADNCQIQAARYQEKAEVLRQTTVSNFDASEVMSDEEVEAFLDEFPQTIFKKVQTVQFDDRAIGDFQRTVLGNTHWDPKSGKAKIDLYRHPFKELFPAKKLTEKYTEIITHEIGHTIFQGLMSDKQRLQWGEWYLESLKTKKFITKDDPGSREEDFCECFVEFKTIPEKLKLFDPRRFNFIFNIYQDLEGEGNQLHG